MASRVKKHHVIRNHDTGTVTEYIEIEVGESVKPDETTPRAEDINKKYAAEQAEKISSAVFDSMDGLFKGMENMFDNMGKMFDKMF